MTKPSSALTQKRGQGQGQGQSGDREPISGAYPISSFNPTRRNETLDSFQGGITGNGGMSSVSGFNSNMNHQNIRSLGGQLGGLTRTLSNVSLSSSSRIPKA